MIAFAYAPPCGTAASLTLGLSADAEAWRLLRRPDEDFDATDGATVVIASGEPTGELIPILDYADLTNGVPAYYRLDERVDGAWVPSGDTAEIVPAYLAEPLYRSPDLASLMRDRLASALKAEVVAGRLRHESGEIPVLTAYPQIDSARLPLVTVILTDRRAEVRGIGEIVTPDLWEGGAWDSFEGWLDRSTIQIGVWSLNHVDRLQLRDAVQRAILLNLPILDDAGFTLPDLSESDTQDFETFGAPVYQSIFTLSALHAALVRTVTPAIRIVEATVNAEAIN